VRDCTARGCQLFYFQPLQSCAQWSAALEDRRTAGFCSRLRPKRVKSEKTRLDVRFTPKSSRGLECSLPSTRENDFGWGSLSLGQERRPVLLFENEGAARAYGKRIEDTFVSLARNRAGLATFSIDEMNDRSTWGACRARRPSWTRRSFRCDLLLFAGSESQRQDNGEQANGHDG
jgi:hypothetical protein